MGRLAFSIFRLRQYTFKIEINILFNKNFKEYENKEYIKSISEIITNKEVHTYNITIKAD